jgi:hypothetical protein
MLLQSRVGWQCIANKCQKPYSAQATGKHVDFPAGGLEIGQMGTFRCLNGYAMPPSSLSPFPRKEITIYCLALSDASGGEVVGYYLINGLPVPKCEQGGWNSY